MLGGLAIFHHCWTLYRDKQVKGVSVFATVFFTTWGYWNLYYYPHLNQWVSFAGGVMIVTANTLWIAMMAYYLRKAKRAAVLWAYGPNTGLAIDCLCTSSYAHQADCGCSRCRPSDYVSRHNDADPYCNCMQCH